MHPKPVTSLSSFWLRSGLVEKILLSQLRWSLSENIWSCNDDNTNEVESFTIQCPMTVHFSLHILSWIVNLRQWRRELPCGFDILLLSVWIHAGIKAFLNPVYFSTQWGLGPAQTGFVGAVAGRSPTAEPSLQQPEPHWALSRETSLSSISTLVTSCCMVAVAGQPQAAFGMLMRCVNVTLWFKKRCIFS